MNRSRRGPGGKHLAEMLRHRRTEQRLRFIGSECARLFPVPARSRRRRADSASRAPMKSAAHFRLKVASVDGGRRESSSPLRSSAMRIGHVRARVCGRPVSSPASPRRLLRRWDDGDHRGREGSPDETEVVRHCHADAGQLRFEAGLRARVDKESNGISRRPASCIIRAALRNAPAESGANPSSSGCRSCAMTATVIPSNRPMPQSMPSSSLPARSPRNGWKIDIERHAKVATEGRWDRGQCATFPRSAL